MQVESPHANYLKQKSAILKQVHILYIKDVSKLLSHRKFYYFCNINTETSTKNETFQTPDTSRVYIVLTEHARADSQNIYSHRRACKQPYSRYFPGQQGVHLVLHGERSVTF